VTTTRPPMRVVSGSATAEEVAAITSAIATLYAEYEGQVKAAAATPEDDGEHLHAWVRSSRLTARRAGSARGPWRLSGRIGRRARA
jgi:hypothetical protein